VNVRLIVLGESPPHLGATVAAALPRPFFGREATQGALPVSRCYDASRAQVDASLLLDELPDPRPGWVHIAITAADLFVPPLAYVFGLSALGAGKGVVSWARLRVGEWDESASAATTRRLVVETVHELGHTVGLIHCVVPDCAMHRSLWPEAVDLKQPAFCPACLDSLHAQIGAVSRMA
jgi:archaemetzincin